MSFALNPSSVVLALLALVPACHSGAPRETGAALAGSARMEPQRADREVAGEAEVAPQHHVDLSTHTKPDPIRVPAPPGMASGVNSHADLRRRTIGIGQSPLAIRSRGPAGFEIPWAVFGLPWDGAGSLWFLGADGVHPEPQRPGEQHGEFEGYGRVIEHMGELDGDPVSELLVSAFGTRSDPGRVFVVSPVSREVLHAIPAPPGVVQFGRATCPVRDFDGDGLPDVAVLGVHAAGTPLEGRAVVHVCSLRTGAVLHTPLPEASPSSRKYDHPSLRWLPLDLQSGGGLLLVGLPSERPGTLRAIDVASGDIAWRLEGETPEESTAWSIDLLGQDIDGDGVDEVVVGDLGCGAGVGEARVRVLSGRDGQILTEVTGLGGDTEVGLCVSTGPDFDGDGVNEILVGDERPYVSPGTLWVLSGRDGRPLRRFEFENGFWTLGHRIDVGMDVDGGGLPDVLLSSYIPTAGYEIADAFGVLSLEQERLVGYVRDESLLGLLAERDRRAVRAAQSTLDDPVLAGTLESLLGIHARIPEGCLPGSRKVELAESVNGELFESGGAHANDVPPAHGLGSSFAPIAADADSAANAPRVAFGLPFDNNGSLWFLTPGGVDPECLVPEASLGRVTHFAERIASLPDVDGDGISDLAVAAPGAGEDEDEGVVLVVSTQRREVLHAVRGPEGATRFGLGLAALSDLDGDGLPELAVVGVDERVDRYRARAALHIVSPGTGEILATPLRGFEVWPPYEPALAWLPPFDGNGESERAGTIVLRRLDGPTRTLVAVDPMSGQVRWQVPLPRSGSALDLCAGSDVNGDGARDLVLVDNDFGAQLSSGGVEGRVRVLSGRSGVLLHGTRGLDSWGAPGLALGPDLDGDGLEEVLVMEAGVFSSGRLLVLAGRDGVALAAIKQSHRFWRIEQGPALGSDWDGGGLPDYIVASSVPEAGNQSGAHAIGVVSLETDLMFHYITPSVMKRWIDRRDGKR